MAGRIEQNAQNKDDYFSLNLLYLLLSLSYSNNNVNSQWNNVKWIYVHSKFYVNKYGTNKL